MFLAWEKIVEQPHSDGHLVQLYKEGEDAELVRNVGRFLSEGLRKGDAALVVANARHRDAFAKEIGPEARSIRFFDSAETLGRLMVRGQPDWDRFKEVIGRTVEELRESNDGGGLLAYGDLVNILWKSRQHAAAIRLEQLWNRLLSRSFFSMSRSPAAGFSLYCGYSIDPLGGDFQPAALDGILSTHTHMIPSESEGRLETAIRRALDEVLGEAGRIGARFETTKSANGRSAWAVIPSGESIALWVRKHFPEQSEEIFHRARKHYRELAPV
ncbi:MAG TPA: MEDS domain-containing protein [Bryobacteraceae bacterium]|nr:MEDS domain-containing protein [Bryobacteraceae bacterium]